MSLRLLDCPSAPSGPLNIDEMTPEYAVLSWRPPRDDGGKPIQNYIIEKKDADNDVCYLPNIFISKTSGANLLEFSVIGL